MFLQKSKHQINHPKIRFHSYQEDFYCFIFPKNNFSSNNKYLFSCDISNRLSDSFKILSFFCNFLFINFALLIFILFYYWVLQFNFFLKCQKSFYQSKSSFFTSSCVTSIPFSTPIPYYFCNSSSFFSGSPVLVSFFFTSSLMNTPFLSQKYFFLSVESKFF